MITPERKAEIEAACVEVVVEMHERNTVFPQDVVEDCRELLAECERLQEEFRVCREQSLAKEAVILSEQNACKASNRERDKVMQECERLRAANAELSGCLERFSAATKSGMNIPCFGCSGWLCSPNCFVRKLRDDAAELLAKHQPGGGQVT